MLGEAAAAAAKTDTFLGARYRRLVKRRGKLKALVAVARSILVIVWHLLADPTSRYHDLGADYHTRRIDNERRNPQPRPPARSPRLHTSPSPPPPDRGHLTLDRHLFSNQTVLRLVFPRRRHLRERPPSGTASHLYPTT